MDIRLVNLTPHPIVIVTPNGKVDIAPSGDVPRIGTRIDVVDHIGDIPCCNLYYTEVEGLPAPVDGTLYIVSSLVAQWTGRLDLAVPGDLVRDDQGRVIGCQGLILKGNCAEECAGS